MSKLYRFGGGRKSDRATFFDRDELNQLLSLYSQRVASGEWRDYAIDHNGGTAIFSVFRHTLDSPIYSISKRIPGPGKKGEFVVFSGRETVKRAATINEALAVFERNVHVVSH